MIDATIRLIDDPELTVEQLMVDDPETGRLGVKGPDFPTAGFIYGKKGIHDAFTTGRGRVVMRARANIEPIKGKKDREQIVVTELPYQVNKAELLKKIADLVRDKRVEGISDLRDESDRDGMRMVIELKKDAHGEIVLNKLFTMTPMQSSFGIINLAIVGGQPRVLTLKELLVHFINHRRAVVTRRCRYELRKAQERAHVLEGYLIALANIDEVVELVKQSATPAEARAALVTRFELTEVQAQSILDMRLQRLTGMEVEKIKEEYAQLQETIARLEAILASDELLNNVIIEELERVEEQYGDERRTQIVDASSTISMEDLIADEDMVVTVTTTGYIKRTPLSEYRTQRRGGMRAAARRRANPGKRCRPRAFAMVSSEFAPQAGSQRADGGGARGAALAPPAPRRPRLPAQGLHGGARPEQLAHQPYRPPADHQLVPSHGHAAERAAPLAAAEAHLLGDGQRAWP